MLLLPIASFHLVMYVAQKEEFEGAKSKKGFATSGSDGKDAHCDLVARTQQTDPGEWPKAVSRRGRETSFFGWCWGLQYRLVATTASCDG